MRLAGRIGANHLETVVGTGAPVADARRQDQHVAPLEPEQPAALAAETQGHFSFGDAEDFMRVRMKMRVVVDRVRTDARPAVLPERLSETPGLGGDVLGEHAAKQQDREIAVGNVARFREIDLWELALIRMTRVVPASAARRYRNSL